MSFRMESYRTKDTLEIKFAQKIRQVGEGLCLLSDHLRVIGKNPANPADLQDDDNYNDQDILVDIEETLQALADNALEVMVDIINVQRMGNLLDAHNTWMANQGKPTKDPEWGGLGEILGPFDDSD
tara:strand:- start:317 stop:694 length:378 start_codon:yes stop_codon:yes gene_type:complete